jgi:hypothetical protein
VRLAAVAAALGLLISCTSAKDELSVRHAPPERKDIIEAVMASHDVPLSVSPTCADVGTKSGDTTVGAYLSGFIAEMKADRPSKNWIDTHVTEAEGVWKCVFTVRHSAGEDEWGWGVRFNVRRSDRRVVRESFECTGGG